MKDIKKILEYAKYTFDEAEKVKEYTKYFDEVKDESQTSSDNHVRRTLNDHISEVLNLNTKKEK